MQIKTLKNAYCDVIACGLGGFIEINKDNYKDIENSLMKEEIDILCHYAVVKNKLAGVGEVNLKVPFLKNALLYLEKYDLKGSEILDAKYVNSLSAKDLVGGRFILEIEDLTDYNQVNLSDLSDFCGLTKTPIFIHFGTELENVGQIMNKFGLSPAELLEEYGLLDRECFLYGMNYIDKDDQILLAKYNPRLILSPRSDGEEGKGAINLYNLIYNGLKFCFSSGKCYNIDMLKEGKLALINTNNLMNTSGLVSAQQILQVLQSDYGNLNFVFDYEKREDCILEEGKILVDEEIQQIKNQLEAQVKQIAKRIKGEK